MSELALALKTPVEELIPAMLAWNNKELMEAVTSTLSHYEGITYDDEHIGEAKNDRARLNAFVKALNDERIRIGKVYSAPYEKFKGEVDEVVKKVKETVASIDEQVKTYEAAKQEAKQAQIKEYFDSAVGDLAALIPYERVYQAKWLNASTSMKSIKADIDKAVENANNALQTIEALHSPDEATIKAVYFRSLDLAAAIMENDHLQRERQRVAEVEAQKAAQKAQEASKVEAQINVAPASEIPVTKAPAVKTQVVRFQVEGTIDQLKALQHFLHENNIKYSAI